MSVKTLGYNQCATILKSLIKQAKGTDIAQIEAKDFVSVGTTLLECGYNTVVDSISTVLSNTFFAVRPYEGKLWGLYKDEEKWGIMSRKMTAIDTDPVDNQEYKVTEDGSIDQYKFKKPQVVETHFYSGQTYMRQMPSITREQLNTAFSSPAELGRFWQMMLQNMRDMVTQDLEVERRATVANLIAGRIARATDSPKKETECVVYLVSEYNKFSGKKLDATTVKSPENWTDFVRWAFGYIRTISEYMTERTDMYHTNLTIEGVPKSIPRHTPLDRQHLYLLSSIINPIETTVMSTTFNDEYLKQLDFEKVSYWQAIKTPDKINVNAGYMDDAGAKKEKVVNVSNVFGVLFDDDACGQTLIYQWAGNTPFNVAGGYYNMFEHYTSRFFNDFTENAIVFLLDVEPSDGGRM